MAATGKTRAYLDYNATSPMRPEARDATVAALDVVGNPSSVHGEGRAARLVVEKARAEIAHLTGSLPRCVTFVSGGTEAAATALNPAFGAGPGAPPIERLIVSGGEHPCVLSGHRFPTEAVETAPLTAAGVIDLDWLAQACARPGRALLALQGANNETGAIQPVAEAAALVHAAGGYVFCDAVQLAGRADCSLGALGADALSLSAHKIGGPKGAGALVTARPGISLGEPLGSRRGTGARRAGGHRERRRHRRVRGRRPGLRRRPRRGVGAPLRAARPPRRRGPRDRARRGRFCRTCAPSAEYGLFRGSRP